MTHAIKLGILVSHPIQYFVPVYRELAKLDGIELSVIYRTRVGIDHYDDKDFGENIKWDIPLLGGYNHHFLSDKKDLNTIELQIIPEILRRKFDVLLVHGYNSLTNILAIIAAKVSGTRILLRGDSRLTVHHFRSPVTEHQQSNVASYTPHPTLSREGEGFRCDTTLLTASKRTFKRFLFGLFDGFVSIGSSNRDYYLAHGVPEEKIFFAPFSVENGTFQMDDAARLQARTTIRENLQMSSNAVCILSASKLIPRKRINDLIAAFANIQNSFPNACLLIAGSGKKADALQNQARLAGINNIRFLGFKNQSELPALYAASDLFVLPSSDEPWGLAVNEAMAAGLPVIVSDEVGAAPDLVAHKGTGVVHPCGDVMALATAMTELLANPKRRNAMAITARELIKQWDTPACAQKLAEVAQIVATGQSPAP